VSRLRPDQTLREIAANNGTTGLINCLKSFAAREQSEAARDRKAVQPFAAWPPKIGGD